MRVSNGRKTSSVERKISSDRLNGTVETLKSEEVENDVSVKEVHDIVRDNTIKFVKKEKVGKVVEMKNLTAGRVVSMIMVGLLTSTMLAGVVWFLYNNHIRYPESSVYNVKDSGLGALNEWVDAINDLGSGKADKVIGEQSYLSKEVEYANGKEYHIEFIKKVVGTVSYTPDKVKGINKYGNTLLDKDGHVVYVDSLVNEEGERVTLSYIDYSKIDLNADKITEIMEEVDLKVGDVDYSNRLIEVFCRYIVSLEDSEIPLVKVKHTPSLEQGKEGYLVTKDEDIYLDKELFSSESFKNLLHRFSLAASGEEGAELEPLKEWVDWNNKSEEEKKDLKEPDKYDYLKIISLSWCGSYYLLNEFSENPITAEVGDGSLDNPAGLNTNIITSVFVENRSGERVEKPIRVRLLEYNVSQDAIDYFEGKDERNRGFDIKSEIQYVSYVLEVTNLSDSELTIHDDSSLSDDLANMAPRTGRIYGLNDSVTLKPHESGTIESWGCSTELNKKYLVWGKSFQREKEVVWFRVLAGNIDDPSEDKGVVLNNSRYGD